SPLAKESDEEGKATTDEKKPDDAAKTADAAAEPKPDEKPAAPKKPPAKTVIDMDGLTNRIQALPLPAASYGQLQVAKTGELYYIKHTDSGRGERQPGTLMHYSLSKRKEEPALEKVLHVELSRDGKRMLLRLPENAWSIADVA